MSRRILWLVASLVALCWPSAAFAVDVVPGGVLVDGSAMKIGVQGGAKVGYVNARFATAGAKPLFWDTGINTATGLIAGGSFFSVHANGVVQALTETTAPVLSGTGTVLDPWTAQTSFTAGAVLNVMQVVTHVDGTYAYTEEWLTTNVSGAPLSYSVFKGADLYVSGNDSGSGSTTGTAPNRLVSGTSPTGVVASMVESTPWSHFFEGSWSIAVAPRVTGTAVYNDTVNPAVVDNGVGVQWDVVNAATMLTSDFTVTWTFVEPALPPSITAGPAAASTTTSPDASFAFAAAAGDAVLASFECSLDSGTYAACTSPFAASGLPDGSHTFRVRGLDAGSHPGAATTRTWTVDTPPAAPSITAPPAVTNAAGSVAFTGAEAGGSFECQLDGGGYAACTSPYTFGSLADGAHTLQVRQVGAGANIGAASAVSWTVDATPPAAPTIQAAPDATTTATSATLVFAGEPGASFACALDGAPAVPCTSPVSYSGLGVGAHSVAVTQTDALGNTGVVVTVAWAVVMVEQPKDVDPAEPKDDDPVVTPPRAGGAFVAVADLTVARSARSLIVGCGLRTGKIRSCSVRLVAADAPAIVLAVGARSFTGADRHGRVTVTVRLTAAGRRLAARVHGVRAEVRASIEAVDNETPLKARGESRVVVPRVLLVAGDLTFEPGSAALSTEGTRYLAEVAGLLDDARRLRCDGHTDGGMNDYTLRLGLARARAVCAALAVGRHLPTRSVSFGGERHRVPGDSPLNRRVEVQVSY